jgi:hypothetical protein
VPLARPERQLVAHAGHRLDRLLAKCLPEARDLDRQVALLHDQAGPDVIQKLRLGHHTVGMVVQVGQHIIGPCAQRQVRPIQPRHALVFEDIQMHLSPAFSLVKP